MPRFEWAETAVVLHRLKKEALIPQHVCGASENDNMRFFPILVSKLGEFI